MAYIQTGTYRAVTSYFRSKISPREINSLVTSGDVDDELWIILEYYSEVESVGLEFLRNSGITNLRTRKKTYKAFQAYVRQAKNYYNSAKSLQVRSSGLLYYYCFLNLAKAALVISDPTISGSFIRHGLQYHTNDNSSFSSQKVLIEKSGVFRKLYEFYFGKSPSSNAFNIQTLLSYCTDISYQNDIAGVGADKVIPAFSAIAMDDSRKKNWNVVIFPNLDEVLKYKKTMKTFFENFEKVEIPQNISKEIFGLNNSVTANFGKFQSKTEKNWLTNDNADHLGSREELVSSLKDVFQTNYFMQENDFYISLPYKINKQEQIDETLAIYVVMFYISSLVRYKPDYLEGLLSKKEAWLIESFIKSCPKTFLRSMISRIVKKDFALETR